jgi:cysteine/glycine-rich protein
MSSFTGTQDKCKTCDKTVHFIDLLTADGVSYHKTCFKCSHCKGTLSVRTLSIPKYLHLLTFVFYL